MTEEEKENLKEQIGPILGSTAMAAAVVLGTQALKQIVVTGLKQEELTGDLTLKPSGTETTVGGDVKMSSLKTEGSGVQEGVNGSTSNVNGNENEGNLTYTKQKGLGSNVQAVESNAGGINTVTKGLNITG